MNRKQTAVAALGASALGLVAQAHAAAPAWVTTAISNAEGTFTDYLGAAAPTAAVVVAVFGGFLMVMKLISRITQGRG